MSDQLLLLLKGGAVLTTLKLYILSVTVTALYVSICSTFISDGPVRKSASLIGSLILVLTVLAPVINIDETSIKRASNELQRQFDLEMSKLAVDDHTIMEDVIREQCEAYILDKAEEENMSLEVFITMGSESDIPIPVGAEITGSVSDAQQEALSRIISEDLGIPLEMQEWKMN